MIVNVYIVMRPGGDRPYVSTFLAPSLIKEPGTQVFLAEVDVPGFKQVDGIIRVAGAELPQAGAIPLSADQKNV
jgi:hypothetical protein